MAIPRPPNSQGTLYRNRSGSSTLGFSNIGDYNSPIGNYNTITRSYPYERDDKSAPRKGQVITLPGGNTFRKATEHSRASWVVGESSPARAEGIWNNRRYDAIDTGVDGVRILSNTPRLCSSIPTDAANEAHTKALQKLADSKANMGENLGTFGQTVSLFAGKAKLTAELASAIKNKNFRKYAFDSYREILRRGVSKSIANAYLEYIYGFAPLMRDMYGLYEFSKQVSSETMLYHGHGSASRTYSKSSEAIAGTTYSEQKRVDWTSDVVVRSHLWARLDPIWGGLRAWNQLGLLNPAATAWELVPWSFVVDWLIPIGPVLTALSAPAGLIFVDGSISYRVRESHVVEYWISRGTVNPRTIPSSVPAMFPVTYEGYSRIPLSNWPRPGLWIDSDPLRGSRIFQAAALAISQTGRDRNSIRGSAR